LLSPLFLNRSEERDNKVPAPYSTNPDHDRSGFQPSKIRRGTLPRPLARKKSTLREPKSLTSRKLRHPENLLIRRIPGELSGFEAGHVDDVVGLVGTEHLVRIPSALGGGIISRGSRWWLRRGLAWLSWVHRRRDVRLITVRVDLLGRIRRIRLETRWRHRRRRSARG